MVSLAALVGYAIVACMLLGSAVGPDGVFWFVMAELSVIGSKVVLEWYRGSEGNVRDFLLLADREY